MWVRSFLMLAVPLLIMRNRKKRLIRVLGSVGTAYAAGLAAAQLFALGERVQLLAPADSTVGEITAFLSIALAIPLLLFSLQLCSFETLRRGGMLRAFLLHCLALTITVTGLYALLFHRLENGAVLSGTAEAVYIGGTPNLNAVAYFFGLDSETILSANLSDMVFGGLFYLFLLFLAKPLCRRVLGRGKDGESTAAPMEPDEEQPVCGRGGLVRNIALALLLAAASAGAGVLLWKLRGGEALTDYLLPAMMLGTTLGGLAFSRCPRIRNVRGNETAGEYFTVLFGYALASSLQPGLLLRLSPEIFLLFAAATAGSFLVHLLLCRLFGVGTDAMLVSSVAGIYGPAYVPGVCRAIRAEALLPAGLLLGSLGSAAASWAAILLVWLLRLLPLA